MAGRGLVLAAPASGSGKTLITLGLLGALKRRGMRVAGAKSGPDYIDPQFHEAACGIASVNLDAWAMDAGTLIARAAGRDADFVVVEGAMGVLDGAGTGGRGSVADLAETLGLPVVLIVDAAKLAQSAALPVAGLKALRPGLALAGVIFNRVASHRHAAMLEAALAATGVPVLGSIPRDTALTLPERHLGLVQAEENSGLPALLDLIAETVAAHVDLDRLMDAAKPLAAGGTVHVLPPPGQRVAIARDVAFSFFYPHMAEDWRAAGAELSVFSPLADEVPASDADAIVLPGGYPELHAGRIAGSNAFRAAMRAAADAGTPVYGECGGYMVLGRTLTDADGLAHPMLDLLPLDTTFAERRLHLGYRHLTPMPGGPFAGPLMGHEFHYAVVTHSGDAPPLFEATDAFGEVLAPMGHRVGSVCGSFAHVIGPSNSAAPPAST
ncbi:MAG: cobyrinate a,c-diamide synthase [Rhodobiaceae bacterium]|nr:cobyrinate a,c-diamide synthase [Rhodobiaceae bacterium]